MGLNRRSVPPPLPDDALIRVIAPAGPSNAEKLAHGVAELSSLGYRVECSPGCTFEGKREHYLAADDERRGKDLVSAICKHDCDAVMVTRGGYGTMRLLEQIPYPGVKNKWIAGFSDLTALSLALYERRRMVTLSGPIIAASDSFSTTGPTVQTWHHWVTDGTPVEYPVTPYKSGHSHGVLLGGCLSLICALWGTRYSPSYQNAILLLEDIDEPEYKIDRMLTQLALGGVFQRVAGVVIGQFCNADFVAQQHWSEFAAKRICELLGQRRVPVVIGFPYGHFGNRVTVPIGGDAIIDKQQLILALPERKS